MAMGKIGLTRKPGLNLCAPIWYHISPKLARSLQKRVLDPWITLKTAMGENGDKPHKVSPVFLEPNVFLPNFER